MKKLFGVAGGRCRGASWSPTKARKGSMEMLMEASRIHSMPAATHSEGTLGKANRASRRAPRRRGSRAAAAEAGPGAVGQIAHHGLHDQAGQRGGDPQQRDLVHVGAEGLEDAADVGVPRAKPNWMPRKPKHMFQICQNDSVGLVVIAPSARLGSVWPVCAGSVAHTPEWAGRPWWLRPRARRGARSSPARAYVFMPNVPTSPAMSLTENLSAGDDPDLRPALLIWRLGRTDYVAPLVVVQILTGILLGPGLLGAAFPDYYRFVFTPGDHRR